MATPYHVHVQPADTGILRFAQTDPSAAKASELLQRDLEVLHSILSRQHLLTLPGPPRLLQRQGLPQSCEPAVHHHTTTATLTPPPQITHHLLTLYGTGATPDILQHAYSVGAPYQIRAKQPAPAVIAELKSDYAANAPKYLGKGKHYPDFLAFFQAQIDSKGWQPVLAEYVFRDDGDPVAHDLFGRLYAGFLHPMIQLMFGVEWQQPAIVAEALAQAAVHENNVGEFLTQAEQRANEKNPAYRPLTEFFDEVRDDEKHRKLATSVHWEDPNRIYDGVLKRAPDEALKFVSGIKVRPEDLDERTVEMVHNAAYVAAAASWHPPHIPKFDFFLM